MNHKYNSVVPFDSAPLVKPVGYGFRAALDLVWQSRAGFICWMLKQLNAIYLYVASGQSTHRSVSSLCCWRERLKQFWCHACRDHPDLSATTLFWESSSPCWEKGDKIDSTSYFYVIFLLKQFCKWQKQKTLFAISLIMTLMLTSFSS